MNPPLLFRSEEDPRHLPAANVLISIFGFWLFYAALITARSSIMGFPEQGELFLRRMIVTGVSILLTIGLWQAIRPFDRHLLPARSIIAALLCLPFSILAAFANYYFFNLYDPESLAALDKYAGVKKDEYPMWVEVAELAMSRYFFLIAWAAVYLAMGYAYQVRIAEQETARFARAAQLSELRALRYQINPHFLFNTLNSLSALVMKGKREEAETMIMNLSQFYRTSLSGNVSGDVSLMEEIDLQKRYLDIESVRFSDRLSVVVDVPEALQDYAVPGMILQPLVENAIKHAVSRTTKPVTLTICARETIGALEIDVSDNAPPGSKASDDGEGIGLDNVRDRLAARFGTDARLETASLPEGGYRARLVIPAISYDN
jgi:two-component system, LytTR family, sensor kinase